MFLSQLMPPTIQQAKSLYGLGVMGRTTYIRMILDSCRPTTNVWATHEISVSQLTTEGGLTQAELLNELANMSRDGMIEGLLPEFSISWTNPELLSAYNPEQVIQLRGQGMFRQKGYLFFCLSADNPAKNKSQTVSPPRIRDFYKLNQSDFFGEIARLTGDGTLVSTLDRIQLRWIVPGTAERATTDGSALSQIQALKTAVSSLEKSFLTAVVVEEMINRAIAGLKTPRRITTDPIVLCVNNIVGSDANGNGTSEKPFSTLGAAFSWASQNLDLTYSPTNPTRGKIILQVARSNTVYTGLRILTYEKEVEIIGETGAVAPGSPEKVIINSLCESIFAELTIRNVEFALPASTVRGIGVARGRLYLDSCNFRASAGSTLIILGAYGFIQLNKVGFSSCAFFIKAESHSRVEFLAGCALLQDESGNNPTFSSMWVDISRPESYLFISSKPAGVATATSKSVSRHSTSIISNKSLIPDGMLAPVVSDVPTNLVAADLLNGWAATSPGVFYIEENSGFISLQGAIAGTTPDVVAFKLPFKVHGLTDAQELPPFPTINSTGTITARIRVRGDGSIIPSGFTAVQSPQTLTLSLSGIRFRAT
jgi:hypothetical protein